MLSSDFNLSSFITPSRPIIDTVDLSSTSGEHERGVVHRLPGIAFISEWRHGSFVENLAATHNGHILVTVYSSNEIYQIDPNSFKSNRMLLAARPTGPTGIVEVDFNHFYVSAGSIGQRNTWSIYSVDLHHGNTPNNSFKQILDIDSALYLNGLCVLSYEQGILLSVDSMLGQIFKINLHTKQSELWYENDLLKSRSHDVHVPGINGIRRCSIDGCIYLTNTDRAIILRLAIDPFDYRPKEQLETIVRNIVCDDFTIDRFGTIYATTHAHNSLIRLTPIKDGEYLREEIATIEDGLAGATSCIFGRTYHDRTRPLLKLYIRLSSLITIFTFYLPRVILCGILMFCKDGGNLQQFLQKQKTVRLCFSLCFLIMATCGLFIHDSVIDIPEYSALKQIHIAENLKKYTDLENEVNDRICKQKVLAKISTHDLSFISGNLVYDACQPEEIGLVPLGEGPKIVSARNFYDGLCEKAEHERRSNRKKKSSNYHRHLTFTLIPDQQKFPYLYDQNHRVISLPPY